jgi:hypothetical protein
MSRARLPNRRPCEILDIQFRGARYSLLIGRFEDGTIGEVFAEPRKVASDGAEDSRDVGIIISIALQNGVPLESMRAAVSRIEQGRPSSLTGYVLDTLAAENATAATIGGAA